MIFQSQVADTPVEVVYHMEGNEVIVDKVIGKTYGNILWMMTVGGSTIMDMKEKFAALIKTEREKLQNAIKNEIGFVPTPEQIANIPVVDEPELTANT